MRRYILGVFIFAAGLVAGRQKAKPVTLARLELNQLEDRMATSI